MSWQDQYENAAQEERDTYDGMPVESLLKAIQYGQYGHYNTIWFAITDRATVQQAAWPLFQVLQRDDLSYLVRCNCAEALLELLGRTDVLQVLQETVDLTSGSPADRRPHLVALQQELTDRCGPEPAYNSGTLTVK